MLHCLTSMVQDSCGSTTKLYIPSRCTSTTTLFYLSVHLPLYYIFHLVYIYHYTIYSNSVYIYHYTIHSISVYIMCVILCLFNTLPQGRRFTNFHYYYSTVQDMLGLRDQAHILVGKTSQDKKACFSADLKC